MIKITSCQVGVVRVENHENFQLVKNRVKKARKRQNYNYYHYYHCYYCVIMMKFGKVEEGGWRKRKFDGPKKNGGCQGQLANRL